MARQRVKSAAQQIHSWHELDLALAEIAKTKATIDTAVAAYNKREQQAREKLTEEHAPMRTRIEALEQGMEIFCGEHREDFGKKKSKELQHGTVSYRLGTPKVEKSKKFTFDGVVDLLTKAGERFRQFIRVKTELDKEALIENAAVWEKSDGSDGVDPQMIEELCTAKVVQEETFGYEIHLAV